MSGKKMRSPVCADYHYFLDCYVHQFHRMPDNFAELAKWVTLGMELRERMLRTGVLKDASAPRVRRVPRKV
jgi:hypothetical protein